MGADEISDQPGQQVRQAERVPLAPVTKTYSSFWEIWNIVMTAINTKKNTNGLGEQELEMSTRTKYRLISNSLCPSILLLVPLGSNYSVSLSFFIN